jgi:uroporphyrinogen-III synthase
MAQISFQGLRVLSLESRRAVEIGKLIRNYNGDPLVVPAMREVPAASNHEALAFADGVMRSDYDLVVFLTGVGVRALLNIVETQYEREAFLEALRKVKVVSRGPKPSSVLKELKIPIAATAPEPCTWHEVLSTLDAEFGDSLRELRVAVQEYGASNPELLAALTERCRQLTKVPVYQWTLPDDLQPLRDCVNSIANGSIDAALFLTAIQITHLFEVAGQMGKADAVRSGLQSAAVFSIGPTTSEELRHHGIEPDLEASHPKMGFLVNEAAQHVQRILQEKRNGSQEKRNGNGSGVDAGKSSKAHAADL